VLLLAIFLLVRWCRPKHKKTQQTTECDMLGCSSMESRTITGPSATGQNLSSLTSFSDCAKHASSPLLMQNASHAPAATTDGADRLAVIPDRHVEIVQAAGDVYREQMADVPPSFKVSLQSAAGA
jgi:hypothetical protein